VGSSVLSASSLHAKTFSVDGKRVFIGSLNFDPRSARLNTEMGFLIDSPSLAARLPGAFEGRIRDRSYEVRLSDAGEMYWIERDGERQVRHSTEPGAGPGRRIVLWFLSLLPIDWLL
jgi:cardiolipin synthase C